MYRLLAAVALALAELLAQFGGYSWRWFLRPPTAINGLNAAFVPLENVYGFEYFERTVAY